MRSPADALPDTPDDGPTTDGPVDAPQDAAVDQASDASEDSPLDVNLPDTSTQDGGDADAAFDAPWPPQCGDGYRDPTVEECDDGLGVTTESRGCTDSCVVTDRIVSVDGDVQQRWLASPRGVASGSAGHAIAVVEQLEHPQDLDPRVTVALFDMAGRRLGVSSVSGVEFDVDPAIAPLPNGDFALVVSRMGVDGEGLGLALYRIPASGGDAQYLSVVNESAAYGQHGPAALWAGGELVLAWLDDSPSFDPHGSGRRVCTKRFESSLAASSLESCFDETEGWPSDLAIAFDGSVVLAWREMQGYSDRIVVQGEGWQWESDLLEATSAYEPPALAPLGGGLVLVVATEGEGQQRATVIDAGSELIPFEIINPSTPRYEPSLAVTDDGIYLSWSEPEAPPDGGWSTTLSELYVQKLAWTGAALDTVSHAPIPLPREALHREGDQHRPALVAYVDPGQMVPGGALLACWNDLTSTNYDDESAHGDTVLELIPTPIIRGAVY